jgi:GNAT superfamily N-acetyltransferase
MLIVNHDLARRLEMAQSFRSVCHAEAYQELHPEASVQIEPVGAAFAIFEKPGSPLNRCTGLGFEGPVVSADLEKIEQFYNQFDAPSRISLCPLADPSLLEMLKARGYNLERFFMVLARSLHLSEMPVEIPPGIQIRLVTPDFSALWLATVARGFSAPQEPDVGTYDILAPNFYASNAVSYLAYVDGQPAGGGGMYMHAGVVEFGGASTLPAYRGRGVHTALLEARVQAAHQMSCDLGLVLTAPGSHSQRNVQRLGFEVAYTKAVMVSGKGNQRE